MFSGERCDNTNYRVDKLEAIVLGELKKLALDPSRLQEDKDNLYDTKGKEQALSSQIEKLKEKKSRLIDLYSDGSFSAEMLTEKVKAVDLQAEKLKAEYEALVSSQGDSKSRAEAVKMIKSLGDVLNRGRYEEIRLVIESLIERITIQGDDILIKWRF